MTAQDAGANYILTALLPRLEKAMPGLLDELVSGVRADRDAIEKTGQMTPELESVFTSAETILGRAEA